MDFIHTWVGYAAIYEPVRNAVVVSDCGYFKTSVSLVNKLLINFSGIHGRPYQPFDGVQPISGNADNGYCTHVSILFPTWHRPYLALYEQVLYGLIQQIALAWPAGPVQDQYVAAARNFRIPYWDWAAVPPAGESVLPESIGGSETMSVDGPNGQQVIANPLYSYEFKPLDPNQLPDAPVRCLPSYLI
jgi:tyrosinase